MRSRPLIVALAVALALPGCANMRTTPQWDARFGDATRAAFAQQVIRPDAARTAPPVTGADGAAAAAAQQRYRASFAEAPQQPAVFTIGVSGGK